MPSITMNDVAQRAGVAVGTARRALRGDESVRLYIKERVLKAAKELEYQPNLLARALREKNLRIVPLSILDLATPYFGRLAQNLSRCLVEANLEPALCFNAAHLLQMHRTLSTSASLLVDGLDETTIRDLSQHQKVVTINSCLPAIPGVCDIAIDFESVYREAALAVLRSGRKRIAVCSAPYLESLKHGWPLQKIPPLLATVHESGCELVTPGHAPVFENANELARWLDKHPTSIDAVFCENDLLAGRVFAELATRGISTPEKVLLIGCDADYILPGMWSIEVDTAALAERAVARLLRMLDGDVGGEREVYTPRLLRAGEAARD